LVSIFHPSSLFCSNNEWNDQEFQDLFMHALLKHIETINKLGIKVAWSWEFFNCFWNEVPWFKDVYYKNYLLESIYDVLYNASYFYESPPENRCQCDTSHLDYELSDQINESWFVLLHRILHNDREAFIVIGINLATDKNSISIECNCTPENFNKEYHLIKDPSQWHLKINYMDICPTKLDNWDYKFKLALFICKSQRFGSKEIKHPLNKIEFDSKFKKDFIDVNQEKEKERILIKIAKLLTLNHFEAANDTSIREEKIKEVYRIRISQAARIHYYEDSDKKIFLRYYPSSKHDSPL